MREFWPVFLLCHFVGIIFYFTFTLKYAVDPETSGTYVSLAVQSVLTSILILPFLRVIILIAIPSLLTGRLRTVLLVIIVSWALQIPATNITNNIRNTAEGVACVQERIKESSQEMRQLAGENLKKMTQEKFDNFLDKAYSPFVKMRDTLRKLDDTVTRMIEWQTQMIEKVKSLFESCDELMRAPYYRCNSALEDMFYRCTDVTFDSFCLPIRLLKGVCHSTREALRRTIDAAKETTFYHFYADTRDTVNRTSDSAKSVQLNIAYKHEVKTDFDKNLDKIKKKLREEIAGFESFLKFLVTVLDLLVYPIFISPFIMAILYVIRFNRGEEVDNYFLTKDFDQIDTKRQANGKSSLLPLMPEERTKYINSATTNITPKERRWMMLNIVLTILSGVIPLILAVSDILCYHVTAKSYDFFHSNLTRVDPPNMYELKISGDGFMSELFANLLDVFVPFSSGRRKDIWRDCFEEPTPPDYVLFQMMFLIFIFALVLCYAQTYSRRTRHLIALYYFPLRARPRAIHMYKKILINRQNVLDSFMQRRHHDKKDQPEDVDLGIDDDTQKCIRCSRNDLTLKNASNTRVCIKCNSFYCVDCYTIRQKCINCSASLQKLENSLELYMDSSCSDYEEDEAMEI
ncbi:DC-STAMP domain-containing protein [Aphelenchoides bicaudatus]|nr:DC-STAMP domain-containing protein [Aphelenchoides bicaudatus]